MPKSAKIETVRKAIAFVKESNLLDSTNDLSYASGSLVKNKFADHFFYSINGESWVAGGVEQVPKNLFGCSITHATTVRVSGEKFPTSKFFSTKTPQEYKDLSAKIYHFIGPWAGPKISEEGGLRCGANIKLFIKQAALYKQIGRTLDIQQNKSITTPFQNKNFNEKHQIGWGVYD